MSNSFSVIMSIKISPSIVCATELNSARISSKFLVWTRTYPIKTDHVFRTHQIVKKELSILKEMHEMCADCKKVYNEIRRFFLLAASAKLGKKSVRFLISFWISAYKQ
jgi:hypothetical protein